MSTCQSWPDVSRSGTLSESNATARKVSESNARSPQRQQITGPSLPRDLKQLDLGPSAREAHTLPLWPRCSAVLQGEGQMSSLTWSIIHEAAVTSVPIKRPSALDYTQEFTNLMPPFVFEAAAA